ncbi:luciferin 4-monooxygenase [Halyomorpha halys]|uniref:luciferin 4-monooxygenase n=1 Tax=Halyomorpha halys TaxID=286706 RepID=UPI0006D4F75E
MTAKVKYISGPPAQELDPTLSLAEVVLTCLKRNNVKATAQVEVETGRELTYGHLARQSLSVVQGLLREGVGEGSVVAIVSFNSQEAHVIFLACILIGATAAPIDPSLVAEEMAALLELVSPTVVYTEGGKTLKKIEAALTLLENEPLLVVSGRNKHPYTSFQSLLQPTDPEFRPSITNIEEHVALILFTSGTSGLPKGVMLSDTYLLTTVKFLRNDMRELTFLQTSPLFWLSGVMSLLTIITAGFKMIFLRGPAKEAVLLSTIQNYKVNIWFSAPTTLQSLLVFPSRGAYDISSLQMINCGGAALSADSQLRIQRELFRNRTMLLQVYGMTELGGVSVSAPGKIKPGSCGTLTAGTSVKIEDIETGESLGPEQEGEVCVKVKYFMLGYARNPEATSATFDEDGWFHTGDIGYYDEDGYLYIIDRIKDLIKYKSYQIAPAEIENVLRTHPAVKDCSVFGIPHPTDGDHATAFVVAHKNLTENELLEYVAERVSENKQIRGGIRFVEFIPRTSTGKPKRRALRSQLMSELQGINFMKKWKTSSFKEKKNTKNNQLIQVKKKS